jgi:hypothetical protein
MNQINPRPQLEELCSINLSVNQAERSNLLKSIQEKHAPIIRDGILRMLVSDQTKQQ